MPGAKVRERKGQGGQQGVALLSMVFFLLGPGLVAATQSFEFLPELVGFGGFGKYRFLVPTGVVIHQGQLYAFAIFLPAQQGAIGP